jgi:transcriptional regulator with XRE-family HTH domain
MKLFVVPKQMPTTEFNARFSRRLKMAREDAGIETSARMAELLGIEVHTYRTYERPEDGKNRTPPLHLLPAISSLTGRSIDWLLTGKVDHDHSTVTHTTRRRA